MTSLSYATLTAIPPRECERLLGTQSLGRLAVIAGDQPMVFPVNYALHGHELVFRTDHGTKLASAAGQRVAFEIDGSDPGYQEGWSVLVIGRAYEEHDSVRIRELDRLRLRPWAPGGKDHWMRIVPDEITGRHLVHVEERPQT